MISQKYDNMKKIWSHVFLQKLPEDNQNKTKSTPALRVKLSWRARFQTPTQLETEPAWEESSFASKRYNGRDEVIVWLCSPQSCRKPLPLGWEQEMPLLLKPFQSHTHQTTLMCFLLPECVSAQVGHPKRTCWLCCCSSWSRRARRACTEAKLALSSMFSLHTLSKRSSSTCSFLVRRST